MTDDDTLEAELAALRPRDVSSALRQRVAERVTESRPWSSRRTWRIAAAGAVLAAGLAALLLIRIDWSGRREPAGIPNPPDKSVANVRLPPSETGDTLPTFLAYSRALAQSPEELETLLDRHSRFGSQPGPAETTPFAFTRPADPLHPLSGEL